MSSTDVTHPTPNLQATHSPPAPALHPGTDPLARDTAVGRLGNPTHKISEDVQVIPDGVRHAALSRGQNRPDGMNTQPAQSQPGSPDNVQHQPKVPISITLHTANTPAPGPKATLKSKVLLLSTRPKILVIHGVKPDEPNKKRM